MSDQSKSGGDNPNRANEMSCADFDHLLAEAIDGTLPAMQMERFRAHAAGCGECGPMFTMAERGMRFLTALPEVEPPANLVHNILAKTTMVEESVAVAASERKPSWLRRFADVISPNLAPAMASIMQPRMAMTAAAAFFSISMLLTMGGVRVTELRAEDLKPSNIANSASIRYHDTTAKVVKYYENLRFVYEMETRINALKRAISTEEQPAEGAPTKKKQSQPDNSSESQEPGDDGDDKRNQKATEPAQVFLALWRSPAQEFSYEVARPVSYKKNVNQENVVEENQQS